MQACFRQSLFLGIISEPPSVRAEAAHFLRLLNYFPKTVRNGFGDIAGICRWDVYCTAYRTRLSQAGNDGFLAKMLPKDVDG